MSGWTAQTRPRSGRQPAMDSLATGQSTSESDNRRSSMPWRHAARQRTKGLSLGTLLMSSGAAKWMAATAFPAFGLKGMAVLLLLVVVMFIVQFMHFVFVGTTVMATAMLPMVIALGVEAGLPPALLALPAGMIIGGYPILMFYCTNPNVLVYGTGQLTVADFPRVGIPVSILACIVYGLCAATYWRWIGLF